MPHANGLRLITHYNRPPKMQKRKRKIFPLRILNEIAVVVQQSAPIKSRSCFPEENHLGKDRVRIIRCFGPQAACALSCALSCKNDCSCQLVDVRTERHTLVIIFSERDGVVLKRCNECFSTIRKTT